VSKAHSVLKLHEHGLPIAINGKAATYWFDTGANLSVITESEAKRFGLSIQAVESKAGVMTGAEVGFRIAVAKNVQIGDFHLKNVAFLVFSDQQQPFNTLPRASRGLIGMPVLLALERVSWGRDRRFEITPTQPSPNTAQSNLCFDGKTAVALVEYNRRTLSFTLDTGASNTDLYPPFAAAFPELLQNGKREFYKMQGVGSTENLESVVLPNVEFRIDQYLVALRPATVLLKQNGESSRFFYGNLGIDLLMQPHKTTLDFKNMRLAAQ
jgi:clan AA aspartic protease (TIGR02281 family)